MNFKVLGVEHVAVAVKESSQVMRDFKELFNLEPTGREVVESQKVSTEFLPVGSTLFEFLEATADDSPISKFLEKRGNAVHHIALQVDDIRAAISFMKQKGVRMIDEEPRLGAHNCLTAFLHPKSFHGILIELVQRQT